MEPTLAPQRAMQRVSRLLTRLTFETSCHHGRIDEALYGALEFPSMTSYRRFLCMLYGFQVPLEAMLQLTPGIDLVFVQPRLKAGRIASDLLALGLTTKEFGVLTRRHAIPAMRGVAEAMGWLYVAERMTLHHDSLRHQLAAELPAALELGGSYLGAYTGIARTRWRELGATLDEVAPSGELADTMVGAAHQAFTSLMAWVAAHAPPAFQAARIQVG